ncbi:hypothetical protein KCP73_01625 [Salmonella enterica subsp. enterica]|nr:hypothetical protein KCP73_01625 [Salmonella enterica subsp. enterica]
MKLHGLRSDTFTAGNEVWQQYDETLDRTGGAGRRVALQQMTLQEITALRKAAGRNDATGNDENRNA